MRTKGQQTRTGSGANEVDERQTASALCSTASTLMISAARLLFMFFFFLFRLHQHPKRSTLFTSQTTATHSRRLQSRGAVGVNSSTHNPLAPPRWKLSVHVPVGTAAVFLMPASEVAWECSLFLGQGTYSTEGLHLGAQRR